MRINSTLSVLATSLALCSTSSFAQSARSFELGVQALVDKAGTTDVYVTAKPLDGLGTPSVLKQVQMKSFDSAGTLKWTKNASDVPATVTANPALATSKFSYTDMQRGQPVQSQVLIQTSTTTKTEVYKEKIPVLFRPDLVIDKLNAPATVKPGQPFSVDAIISEIKGDLGAKNIKISLSDGNAEIDSIEAIQLEKSGSTTAVFKAKLMQPGTYTLTAQLSGAAPSEYDTANNAKTVTVKVEDPSLPTNGFLYWYSQDYTWVNKGVNTQYDQAWENTGHSRHVNHHIWARTNDQVTLSFPFKVDFHLSFNNATTTVASGTGVTVPLQSNYEDPNAQCGGVAGYRARWGIAQPAPQTFVYAETYEYCGKKWTTSYAQYWNTNDVYFSKSWYPSTGQVYQSYSNTYSTGSSHYHAGVNDVQGSLTVTDANGVKFGTTSTVSVAPSLYSLNYDSGQVTESWGWYHYVRMGDYRYGQSYYNTAAQ